jgi:hypothetical protein
VAATDPRRLGGSGRRADPIRVAMTRYRSFFERLLSA